MYSRGIIIVVVGVALAAFWSLPELERTQRHNQIIEASSQQTPINPQAQTRDGNVSETLASRAQSLLMTPLTRLLDHSIKKGETLASILSQYGAPKAQATQLLNKITSTLKTEPKLFAGQKLNVEVDASGNLIEMRGSIAPHTALEIQRGLDGELRFAMQQRASAEQIRVVNGSIDSTFAGAALDQGVPYEVIDEVVDLFGGRVEFSRSIQPGDSFVIKYIERRTFDGEELAPGPVLAASLRNGGRSLAAIRYETSPRSFQYYDENGEALGNYFLRYPLKFTRISSMFTKSRFHPVLQRNRPHNGVDFAAPIGTPVRSVAPGIITKAGWLNGGGNTVRIKHSDRWTTEYMHLSSISKGIKPGASVSRGQVIGAVGMTGLSTGPHLHFGLFDRGVYVNPLGSAAPRTGSEAKMPAQQLRAMLELLEGQHQLARAPSTAAEGHQPVKPSSEVTVG